MSTTSQLETGVIGGSVDGLSAAGWLVEESRQATVCADHCEEADVTNLEGDHWPVSHDWAVLEENLIDRGGDSLAGCAAVNEAEQAACRTRLLAGMAAHLAEPCPDEQETHPWLSKD
jgi:hypothetical protein